MSSAVFASSPVAPDLFGQSVGNDRKALSRLFTLCFQDFFGCRKSRFYLIPSRQSARRMKRLTAAGSVSQQRDCRRHRREAVETMRPEGRMTAVITAAMSVAAQCSVIRWLPSPARVKRSRGGAGAVSAGVWPGLLVRLGIFGIFGACRKRRGRLAGFPERGERSGSISGVGGRCRRSCCRRFRCCGRWYCRRFRCLCYCLYRRVCRLRGHLPALRFDAENAVEDMASFAAEQHHVARLQGLTSGGKTVGVGICGGVGGGFVSREPVLLSGGCRRFGISGVSGDRSQYCDVAFAAQQGPHAVALHADLDFVSFGEHRFDLLEKQTVRKLHHGRGFADSPPKIVRQASSAAAASGRHSR